MLIVAQCLCSHLCVPWFQPFGASSAVQCWRLHFMKRHNMLLSLGANSQETEQITNVFFSRFSIGTSPWSTLLWFQLFVRAYTDDGSSKSILVDEKMTVAQVVDILLAKNHFTPNLNWSVVESMPDLYMGECERQFKDRNYNSPNVHWRVSVTDMTNGFFFVCVFFSPFSILLPHLQSEFKKKSKSAFDRIKKEFDGINKEFVQVFIDFLPVVPK